MSWGYYMDTYFGIYVIYWHVTDWFVTCASCVYFMVWRDICYMCVMWIFHGHIIWWIFHISTCHRLICYMRVMCIFHGHIIWYIFHILTYHRLICCMCVISILYGHLIRYICHILTCHRLICYMRVMCIFHGHIIWYKCHILPCHRLMLMVESTHSSKINMYQNCSLMNVNFDWDRSFIDSKVILSQATRQKAHFHHEHLN